MRVRDNIRYKGLEKRVRSRANRGVKRSAGFVRDRARSLVSLKGGKYGRSRPGEPPRRETGLLKRSIRAQKEDDLIYSVAPRDIGTSRGTSVEDYGRYLEFGTTKMAKRPFLRVSLLFAAPKISSFFKDLVS